MEKKISELIKELEKIKLEHGDLIVSKMLCNLSVSFFVNPKVEIVGIRTKRSWNKMFLCPDDELYNNPENIKTCRLT